mmetsp:Transcript_26690/g.30731  ORF Transcript_26690/g.30731 Transcript_26690/m.30731 type:complete len:193 (-) Transcript_26690:145-723(-)
MVCEGELAGATSCISDDAAVTCGSCYNSTSETFEQDFIFQAEMAMKSSLAFKGPTDPEFCVEAVYRICKRYSPEKYGKYSCCCVAEQERYLQCQFQKIWIIKYGVSDPTCEWYGCDRVIGKAQAPGGGGLSSTMIMIVGGTVGSVFIILFVVSLFICRWKKKKRVATEAVEKAKSEEEERDKEHVNTVPQLS